MTKSLQIIEILYIQSVDPDFSGFRTAELQIMATG